MCSRNPVSALVKACRHLFGNIPPGRPVPEGLSTIQEVTGRPARAFVQWVRENAAAFGG